MVLVKASNTKVYGKIEFMSKLSITYKGIGFKNPFILASSPATRNAEMILRGFKAGWGGAVLKTIGLYPETIKNPSQRLYGFKSKSALSGLKNIEMISETPVQIWLDDIKLIKDNYPDRIIITSIMAEANNTDDWQKLAILTQNAGADILELNLSCPNGAPERGMGSYCSEIPHICANITKSVKKVSKVPVWAKLSPNVTDISFLAKACLDAGADGIVAINTVKGFAGINIDTLEPNLKVNEMSAYGGISGEIIKPIALRCVSEIANDHNCYISAAGGISDWHDCVEFMLLGAGSLQICTEVMFKGFSIVKSLSEGMQEYLEKHNHESPESIIGLGLNKITSFENLDKQVKYCAKIFSNNCIKCGNCFTSCHDAAYQAIEMDQSNRFVVNPDKCEGCGLCQHVCPSGCINMQKIRVIQHIL